MKHDRIEPSYHPTRCGCSRCHSPHTTDEMSRALAAILLGTILGCVVGAALTINHYWPAIVGALS